MAPIVDFCRALFGRFKHFIEGSWLKGTSGQKEGDLQSQRKEFSDNFCMCSWSVLFSSGMN